MLALLALPPLVLVLVQRIRIRQRPLARALMLRTGPMALAVPLGGGALATVFKDLAGEMRNHKDRPEHPSATPAGVCCREGACRLADPVPR